MSISTTGQVRSPNTVYARILAAAVFHEEGGRIFHIRISVVHPPAHFLFGFEMPAVQLQSDALTLTGVLHVANLAQATV
jgi:hypothetical protein